MTTYADHVHDLASGLPPNIRNILANVIDAPGVHVFVNTKSKLVRSSLESVDIGTFADVQMLIREGVLANVLSAPGIGRSEKAYTVSDLGHQVARELQDGKSTSSFTREGMVEVIKPVADVYGKSMVAQIKEDSARLTSPEVTPAGAVERIKDLAAKLDDVDDLATHLPDTFVPNLTAKERLLKAIEIIKNLSGNEAFWAAALARSLEHRGAENKVIAAGDGAAVLVTRDLEGLDRMLRDQVYTPDSLSLTYRADDDNEYVIDLKAFCGETEHHLGSMPLSEATAVYNWPPCEEPDTRPAVLLGACGIMPEIEVEPAGSIITLADDVDDYLQDGPPMYDPPGLPFLG